MEFGTAGYFSQHFYVFFSYAAARHNDDAVVSLLIQLANQFDSVRCDRLLTGGKNSLATDLY